MISQNSVRDVKAVVIVGYVKVEGVCGCILVCRFNLHVFSRKIVREAAPKQN